MSGNVSKLLEEKRGQKSSLEASFGEMFGINSKEVVVSKLPLCKLFPFKDQPFKPYSEERLLELAQSIKENGLLNPIIVRKKDDEDIYEILAGNNRYKAAEMAGLAEIEAIIKDVNDDEAIMILTETNLLQRERLFYSEKAKAYKMQLDAISRQGKKLSREEHDNLCTNGAQVKNIKSRDIVAERNNTSHEQVRRYIRLTYLINDLLDMVDAETIPFRVGVELSYLTHHFQRIILDIISKHKIKISLEQAEHLKQLHNKQQLNDFALTEYLLGRQVKPKSVSQVKISYKKIQSFFHEDDTKEVIEETIIKALQFYREQNKN